MALDRMTNTVAVVVRDDGDVVLVDAGWSVATCDDPRRELGVLQATVLGVRVSAADAIVTQLRELGIDPSRVRTIVATHLHLDHVGGVGDFPNAEVVTARRELEAYFRGHWWQGYRAHDLARAGRLRALGLDDGPTYGFPASADLFSDGEVVLLDARGHTAGSVAVALRGPLATYVHVGDAVYGRWEYGMSPPGPSAVARLQGWRLDESERTYAHLRACEADPRRPVLVPSHDAEVFDALPHAPSANAAARERDASAR
jgi:glyoxylase-like metal-dependent hydrolase (beta-lactamase superfamily II)